MECSRAYLIITMMTVFDYLAGAYDHVGDLAAAVVKDMSIEYVV